MDELANLLVGLGLMGNTICWARAGAEDSQRTPTSMAFFDDSIAKLVKQFPEDVQDTIRTNLEAGTTDSQECRDALWVFYRRYLCRLSGLLLPRSIPSIAVPTLSPSGAYDEVLPGAMKPFFDNISTIDSWIIFENSSHTAHLEERERSMRVVGGYLANY
ncbi:hypothetical protein ACEPAI_2747 [Sanghuangporus weigelae]